MPATENPASNDSQITIPGKLFELLEEYASLGALPASYHAAAAIESYILQDARGYNQRDHVSNKIAAADKPATAAEHAMTENESTTAYPNNLYKDSKELRDPCDSNSEYFDADLCQQLMKAREAREAAVAAIRDVGGES